MGLREMAMGIILKHKLLSNQVPDDHKAPLEGWISVKAKKTIKKNRELREEFGGVIPDQLSREDFEKYQLFRVREQMKYAEENVPYYRNKFKDAGIRPEDIRTYDDLTKIPLTEPKDLAESSMLFYGVSTTKMLREFTTTGTTGHRKSIGFTMNDLLSKIDIISSQPLHRAKELQKVHHRTRQRSLGQELGHDLPYRATLSRHCCIGHTIYKASTYEKMLALYV